MKKGVFCTMLVVVSLVSGWCIADWYKYCETSMGAYTCTGTVTGREHWEGRIMWTVCFRADSCSLITKQWHSGTVVRKARVKERQLARQVQVPVFNLAAGRVAKTRVSIRLGDVQV